jgi:hypothetical protein
MPATLDPTKRFIGAHVKAVGEVATDAPYGWVEGVANAFEVDRYGDLVLPEALGAAVDKYMRNPVLSFGHGIDGNPVEGTLPAGTVLNITQDGSGNTVFRARWAGTADAQKVRQLYKDGDMRAFSIHFLPYGDSLESRAPTADEVAKFPGVQRVITRLELIEIACAVVPVNAGSLATSAKSLNTKLMQPKKLSKPFSFGARAMGNKSILTSDARKAIDGARSAYEEHVKALGGIATHLEELAASGEGEEADHGAMCTKCHAAFTKAMESHEKLGESIKSMHKAVTNQDLEDETEPATDGTDPKKDEGAAGGADGDADDGGDGSAPLPTDPEAKAFVLRMRQGFSAKK